MTAALHMRTRCAHAQIAALQFCSACEQFAAYRATHIRGQEWRLKHALAQAIALRLCRRHLHMPRGQILQAYRRHVRLAMHGVLLTSGKGGGGGRVDALAQAVADIVMWL